MKNLSCESASKSYFCPGRLFKDLTRTKFSAKPQNFNWAALMGHQIKWNKNEKNNSLSTQPGKKNSPCSPISPLLCRLPSEPGNGLKRNRPAGLRWDSSRHHGADSAAIKADDLGGADQRHNHSGEKDNYNVQVFATQAKPATW